MITPRFGLVEILITSLTCLLTFGFPAIIIYMLYRINVRLKTIEEKLKDK